MKTFIGLALILLGVVAGLYVGLWVCFIGGIVGLIEAVRAPNLVALDVAWNIAKIFLAGAAGWLSALVFIFPGRALLQD